jgi:hypothetical protein
LKATKTRGTKGRRSNDKNSRARPRALADRPATGHTGVGERADEGAPRRAPRVGSTRRPENATEFYMGLASRGAGDRRRAVGGSMDQPTKTEKLYDVAYRVPGLGWKRSKKMLNEKKMDKFFNDVKKKHGDDVEFRIREAG